MKNFKEFMTKSVIIRMKNDDTVIKTLKERNTMLEAKLKEYFCVNCDELLGRGRYVVIECCMCENKYCSDCHHCTQTIGNDEYCKGCRTEQCVECSVVEIYMARCRYCNECFCSGKGGCLWNHEDGCILNRD